MTAGFGSRSIVSTKVALAPISLVGLLVTALLAGGMLGAAVTSGLGSIGANTDKAQVTATGSSLEEQALIRFRADERASAARASTPHVRDHIGLSERLFPIGPTID
jgi:hypothetical protein